MKGQFLQNVMKLAEIITIFSVVFLVTIATGNGAPQWRPQGRFGKRLDQRFPSSWQLGNGDKSIDMFPVIEGQQTQQESASDEQSIDLLHKLCVESTIPGLYRCYRRKREAFPRGLTDEE
ncbi:uncharacterized protein LOC143062353 isoform X2 [Mytilus galloprovincialis]|uniref:Uncharacterized protein n=2 Tax=Mytilus galloprovincialis TaxID=29158 RepID=A0A8B6CGC8_MYTGA|nr:Hypothetical predicted protein [Mytilus galloprovincialis]